MLVYQRVMESIVCWCVLSFVRCVSVIHARHGMVMNGLASFEAQFDGSHCRIRGFGPSWSTDCNGCGDCDQKLLERMHCKRWLGILYSIVFCIWLVVNILLIMVIIWLLYGYYMVIIWLMIFLFHFLTVVLGGEFDGKILWIIVGAEQSVWFGGPLDTMWTLQVMWVSLKIQYLWLTSLHDGCSLMLKSPNSIQFWPSIFVTLNVAPFWTWTDLHY